MTAILSRPTNALESGLWHALSRVPGLGALWNPAGSSWHAGGAALHAQRSHRIPYGETLWVASLDESHEESPAIVVRGRDVSLTGVSFLHAGPLPSRRIALTFGCPEERWMTAEVELRWCRFTRDGHYLSGGRFLGELAPNPY